MGDHERGSLMPRFGRKRAKPSVITLADRARDQGQWERAAEYYREALQRRPQNPPIWVQYGHVLKESGHLAEAERAYRTALAYDPRNADSHLQLGHVLKVQGKKEEAQAAYLRALSIDPSLHGASLEFAQFGWSEAHVSELRGMLCEGFAGPRKLRSVNGKEPEGLAKPTAQDDQIGPRVDLLASSEDVVPLSLAPATDYPKVLTPDLFELRGLQPRGRIAVVLHVYYAELWEEMKEAIARISEPFDLFVSLTKDASGHMRDTIIGAYPNAWVFDFANRGRDIGPFLVWLHSGVLFQYELVCKLHTKLSPHRHDDGKWRRWLVHSVLGSSEQVDQIVSSFRSNPDLGMVVPDGNIYRGYEHWASNEELLGRLLPRIGISPDVRDRSFPGGSIFWIRPFLLRTLAGAGLDLSDFEPEPVKTDGGLPHAVERIFGLICEEAGMLVAESGQLTKLGERTSSGTSRVHIFAYYLPQFHPIPENDTWWGAGFTEWASVTRAKPLFKGHRQPRLPSDLGFYDLRLSDSREAQAQLALKYGLNGFCYYYYWFNGRRVLERPLEEVLSSGKPDFPFLICWANEPWTRNWDGLGRDVLLSQTYDQGWTKRFAHDVAPLLHDKRYFRLDGNPMLLIYRIGHIPHAGAVMRELRAALSDRGIPEVHLAAAWVWFQEDGELPANPAALGLDAYFEFPPHMLPSPPVRPLPSSFTDRFEGEIYDYNRTVTATLAKLNDQIDGRRHRCAMLGWDNTARTGARAHIFHGATPANFRRWLRTIILNERRREGERVVFINAWNEWAEGTYLEPDRDFGRGWLEAVASAADIERSEVQAADALMLQSLRGPPPNDFEFRERKTDVA
jgi:lipopolysaccharide biosynthesis protein